MFIRGRRKEVTTEEDVGEEEGTKIWRLLYRKDFLVYEKSMFLNVFVWVCKKTMTLALKDDKV